MCIQLGRAAGLLLSKKFFIPLTIKLAEIVNLHSYCNETYLLNIDYSTFHNAKIPILLFPLDSLSSFIGRRIRFACSGFPPSGDGIFG